MPSNHSDPSHQHNTSSNNSDNNENTGDRLEHTSITSHSSIANHLSTQNTYFSTARRQNSRRPSLTDSAHHFGVQQAPIFNRIPRPIFFVQCDNSFNLHPVPIITPTINMTMHPSFAPFNLHAPSLIQTTCPNRQFYSLQRPPVQLNYFAPTVQPQSIPPTMFIDLQQAAAQNRVTINPALASLSPVRSPPLTPQAQSIQRIFLNSQNPTTFVFTRPDVAHVQRVSSQSSTNPSTPIPSNRALKVIDPSTGCAKTLTAPPSVSAGASRVQSRSNTPEVREFCERIMSKRQAMLNELNEQMAQESRLIHTVFEKNTAIESDIDSQQSSSQATSVNSTQGFTVQEESDNLLLQNVIKKVRSGPRTAATKPSDENLIPSMDSTTTVNDPNLERSEIPSGSPDDFENIDVDNLPPHLKGLFVTQVPNFKKVQSQPAPTAPLQLQYTEWLPASMQCDSEEDDEEMDRATGSPDTLLTTAPTETATIEHSDIAGTIDVQSAKSIEEAIKAEGTKRLSKNFILSCYSNPATKVRPKLLMQCTVVLNKPIEHLLDVLIKTMQPGTGSDAAPTSRGYVSGGRRDGYSQQKPIYRSNFRQRHDVNLHHASNPYVVKRPQDIDEIEAKTREFRSLMNKITDVNFERICNRISRILFNSEDVQQNILEVIFDKAIQEPNFVHLYAKICEMLCKQVFTYTDDENNTKLISFKNILLKRVQHAFDTKLSQNVAYTSKLNEHMEATTVAAKKKAKDELNEIVRDLKRRYMGNMNLIGQLYLLNITNNSIIKVCLDTLFKTEEKAEWQYESLCKLLTVIGSKMNTEDKEQITEIMGKMKEIFSTITESRLRFMFLDLFELHEGDWVPKKSKSASNIAEQSSQSSGYGSRRQQPPMYGSSGGSGSMRSSQQGRFQPSGRSDAAGYYAHDSMHGHDRYQRHAHRTDLNFDAPDTDFQTHFLKDGTHRHSVASSLASGDRHLTTSSSSHRMHGSTHTSISKKSSVPTLHPQGSVGRRDIADHSLQSKNAAISKAPSSSPAPKDNADVVNSTKCKLIQLLKKKEQIKFDEFETSLESICSAVSDKSALWKYLLNDDHYQSLVDDENTALRFGFGAFWAIRSKAISSDDLLRMIHHIWDTIDELTIDVPRLNEFIGAFLSSAFSVKNSSCIRRTFLTEVLEPIALTDGVARTIENMIKLACKHHSNEHVKDLLKKFDFDVHQFCSEASIQELLKQEGKACLLSGEMYMKSLYNLLCERFVATGTNKSSNQSLIVNIEKSFKESNLSSAKIMQPTVFALLNTCVKIGRESNYDIDKDRFDERTPLIQSFMNRVNQAEECEREIIHTICDYVQSNENPFGLLQDLLTMSYCNQLLSCKAIEVWRQFIHSSSRECSLPGSLILSVEKFFEWFDNNKQTVGGSDYDDDTSLLSNNKDDAYE